MRKRCYLVFFCLLLVCATAAAQERNMVQVEFYNTENFFDSFDDSTRADEEFTPGGEKHWTYKRFTEKAAHLYKVFMATGGWAPPDLIGLAEVENDYVLRYLVSQTPFSKFGYHFVHFDSPDLRGIDVALLYNPDIFRVTEAFPIRVPMPEGHRPTRDILFVRGKVKDAPDLCIYVNHWPSRSGGSLETEALRTGAAHVLRASVDTLCSNHPHARVLIMGDFNDEPGDESLQWLTHPSEGGGDLTLVNLMTRRSLRGEGTLYYNDRWWLFDQFIVSSNLLSGSDGLVVTEGSPNICREDFLFTAGTKRIPYRTFSGFRYTGGFSDHLPISLKLTW